MQNKEHCLYCGSSGILPVDKEHFLTQSLHIMQCPNCKIMFTELEQRLEADNTPPEGVSAPGAYDEEAALEEAWDLITDNRYNEALVELSRHKYPLANPLMFMIYRNVCQTVSALEDIHILGASKDFDCLPASAALLDLFAHNLRNIDYYLPADDEEERFFILDSISEAVDFLCSGFKVVIDSPLPRQQQQMLLDSVLLKRNGLLEQFAVYLETLRNGSHGSDYQGMAQNLRDIRQMEGEKKDMTIFYRSGAYHKFITLLFSRKGMTAALILGLICLAAFVCLCICCPNVGQTAGRAFEKLAMYTRVYVLLAFVLFVFCLKTAQEHLYQKGDRERRRIYSRLYGEK